MRSRQAFKNLISNLTLQVLTAISGLILPRLYIVVYGSAMNGMVSSVTQFMSYMMLVEAGISAASIVELYNPLAYHNEKTINQILAATKKFYLQSGYLYAGLVLVLTIIYPLFIGGQIASGVTREIIIILSMSNLIDYLFLGKYKVLLTADQRGYVITYANILGTVLNTLISIILIRLGFSIVFVKFSATLVYVSRAVFIYIYIHKAYPYLDFSEAPLKKSLPQRWSALVHQIAGVVLNNTNLVILTIFLKGNSLVEISVYTLYQMVANLITTVLTAFSTALTAGFGELISRNEKDPLYAAYSEYEYMYQMFLFCAYGCMLGLYIPFIKLYTIGIKDGNYVRPVVAVLFVLIGFIQNIRIPGITIICAAGHYSQTQNRALTEAAINLLLALILAGRFGMIGVLSSTLIAFIYSALHVLWYCNKYLIRLSLRKTTERFFRNSICLIISFVLADYSSITQGASDSYIRWTVGAIKYGMLLMSILIAGNSIFEPVEMKRLLKRIMTLIGERKYS